MVLRVVLPINPSSCTTTSLHSQLGEAGRFGFTGRREIGHGALAERSLLPTFLLKMNSLIQSVLYLK